VNTVAELPKIPTVVVPARPRRWGLLRLEAAGVVRARWFAVGLVLVAALLAFFAVLGTRESAVLGFTGLGRVLSGTALASLVFLPLVAIFSTSQAVAQARQQGVLELHLGLPVSRGTVFWAIFLPRLAAVLLPVALLVLGLAGTAAALGAPLGLTELTRTGALLAAQVGCFAALGILVSVTAQRPEQALLRGLALWMATVALLDFALLGAMLRWNLPPETVFLAAASNPAQAGRLGILAGADPDLGLLGPVGMWVATHLGASGTLAYAIGWPAALGAAAVGAARAVFGRADLL
jgi:ABC-type transport system involved in multi-copper enzyme maturation permease subunit